MTIDALLLVAGVDDRVELLEHPLAGLLGADVVDVEEVDLGQAVEQVGVGAGRCRRRRSCGSRPAAAAASRSRRSGRRRAPPWRRASPASSCPSRRRRRATARGPRRGCASRSRTKPRAPAATTASAIVGDRRAVEGDAAVLARDDADSARVAAARDALRRGSGTAWPCASPRRRRSRAVAEVERAGRPRSVRGLAAWSRKRGYSPWNISVDVPSAPLRCLAMMQLGLALGARWSPVVVLVAVDEHHEVGVLLDLAGLAQVGEHRALVVCATRRHGRAATAR